MNHPRPSTFNPSSASHAHAQPAVSTNPNRARQHAHLHAQLATLHARLADTENLLRMTAVQAEYVRGLGGWMGSLFMASSKILGEETIAGGGPGAAAATAEGNAAEAGREGDRSRGSA